ncbi:hypothetical protein, partial [Roseisolibacter sp. H3M3-2]|uniref:hypothetical protein n=1 Tax=Roseisolibacter sp. H3M3-2 TaxID=3031323 RepID=UPI0023DBC972
MRWTPPLAALLALAVLPAAAAAQGDLREVRMRAEGAPRPSPGRPPAGVAAPWLSWGWGWSGVAWGVAPSP